MSLPKRRIVITGIAGRLGRQVARRLHRRPNTRVIGIDRRPFSDRPKDVEHHQVDLRSKEARNVFRHSNAHALIHMGLMHAPRASADAIYSWNISGTARLLEYCQTYAVPKLIVLSSSNVYGPRPDNPQFLTETAPLLLAQTMPEMRNVVELDHMVSSFFWKACDIETVILRPVHILGRVRNAPSNYLRLRRPPTLLGFDPMVQVIHENDVVGVIENALQPNVRGVFNVTGPGELPLSALLAELERRPRMLPHPLAKPLQSGLWRLGLSSFPVQQFDFLRYICMVDGTRTRETLGFRPRHGLKQTIRAVLA